MERAKEMERLERLLEKDRYESGCKEALRQHALGQSMKELQDRQTWYERGGNNTMKSESTGRSPSIPKWDKPVQDS